MRGWHKYKPPDRGDPCTGCQMGWSSYSSEMRDGELWVKTESCFDNCEGYMDNDRKELEVDMAERG